MSGLTFTEDAARHLARVYLTPDVVAQRAETMKQLALSPGERVLDVGCGPGFLCESIAAIVGSDGAVTGIDISSDLIALCRSEIRRNGFHMRLAMQRRSRSPMLRSTSLSAPRSRNTCPMSIALLPRRSAS